MKQNLRNHASKDKWNSQGKEDSGLDQLSTGFGHEVRKVFFWLQTVSQTLEEWEG